MLILVITLGSLKGMLIALLIFVLIETEILNSLIIFGIGQPGWTLELNVICFVW